MNQKTFHLAVIGDPISHSLSPQMHQAALQKLSLSGTYDPILVKQGTLADFFSDPKTKRLDGFNVTVPHKVDVIPFLDELTTEAKLIGAVNTVSKSKQGWIGHNTDGLGFVYSVIEKHPIDWTTSHVTVFGAGGASRAICFALLQLDCKNLLIINRHLNRAESLAEDLKKSFSKAHIKTQTFENLNQVPWNQQTLIINSTSLGLNETWDNLSWIEKTSAETIIADIVYKPRITPLLKEAQQQKRPIVDGTGMLVHQGALAFEIFTENKAPIKTMRMALETNQS